MKTRVSLRYFVSYCGNLPIDSLKRTSKCLSMISFTKYDIAKITKYLNPNKAHGHGMISICMQKICGESILKPLELIFKLCIKGVKFTIK